MALSHPNTIDISAAGLMHHHFFAATSNPGHPKQDPAGGDCGTPVRPQGYVMARWQTTLISSIRESTHCRAHGRPYKESP